MRSAKLSLVGESLQILYYTENFGDNVDIGGQCCNVVAVTNDEDGIEEPDRLAYIINTSHHPMRQPVTLHIFHLLHRHRHLQHYHHYPQNS